MSKSLPFTAAIFDLDGVLTKTARVHFTAWKNTFEDFLASEHGKEDFEKFTYEDDYIPYVDGKPRYQGVKSFLESRDISIPYGNSNDEPDKRTVCGVGNRKNEAFRKIIAEQGVEIYESTKSFIEELRERGIKTAMVSSSKNCRFILEKTRLISLFDAVIDGNDAREMELKGKPDPDIFLVAAEKISADPDTSIMVEDALAGVESGKRGNFGLVLGVARKDNIEDLFANGADIVVKDLAEFSIDKAVRWFETERDTDCWNLTYFGFDPDEEKLREALTTTGNGYFGTRGSLETEGITRSIHYPGTYVMGLFNKLPTEVHGKTIYNNDFVNLPNWTSIQFKIGNGDFNYLKDYEIISYKHRLDFKTAVMSREFTLRDKEGQETSITSERFASMDDMHIGAIRFTITPINYSADITIRSALDGRVHNFGVPRYRDLASMHLEQVSEDDLDEGIGLTVQTNSSAINIYQTARTGLFLNGAGTKYKRSYIHESKYAAEQFSFPAEKGKAYRLEKIMCMTTSKDTDITDHRSKTRSIMDSDDCWNEYFHRHAKAWEKLWSQCDFAIQGDRFSQETIRLHIYHLLATASPNNTRIDAGIPARGLHGEAYRGHFFWDELFILPFYNLHLQDVSKACLMYRYRRLDAARHNARQEGYEGAMFPWQAADDGSEESQVLHYNPRSGDWDPDLSMNQRHISLAIAYNVWSYFYCSHDEDFLHDYGLELLIEICRFWASIASYDDSDGRYHIEGVMGPNEFHEKVPGAEKGGYRDNAYTNIMTAWLLHKTIETCNYVPSKIIDKLHKNIGFKEDELSSWQEIISKLAVPIRDDTLIAQYDGWFDLKELNWSKYRKTYDNIHRLDRILKAEGDSPNKYKISKQADLLQTFYLLSPGQVKHILGLMGYNINDASELVRKNYNYYLKRTTHGSTLSYVVHASITKYIPKHKRDTWRWLTMALKSDVFDTQGGTTPEGIHCGVMAGTIEIVLKNFAGINLFKDKIAVNPLLPPAWRSLNFKMLFRDMEFTFNIQPDKILITKKNQSDKAPAQFTIEAGEKQHTIQDKELTIPYKTARITRD